MCGASNPEPLRKPRFLEHIRDLIVASDPAFSRLRMAGRAMLSLFIAAVALGGFHIAVHPLPIAAFGLGVIISLIGSLMIRDASARGQLISRSYAALGATASVAAASLLASRPALAYAGFLIVIFVAVYIRRYGARWFGVGMIAFMAFFMGDYLHPRPGDLPWVALAAVIAFAATHLVTTVLLKDDPERDFRRALVTIDRRIDLILREIRNKAAEGRDTITERKPFRKHIGQLRDSVLMAEGFIPQGEEGSVAAEGAASDLAVALFELQLFTERLVGDSLSALPDADAVDAARCGDVGALEQWLDRASAVDVRKSASGQSLLRVLEARARLADALGSSPSPAFANAPEIVAP